MMGGIVGGITDAIGLTNHKGEKAAQQAAQQSADRSYAMSKDEIKFQREQYSDWKDIYGTLQEQEADYLQKYTGGNVIASQLANTDKEFKGAETNLTRNLAQRGLSGSGAEAAGLTSLASQEAATKAGIRNSQNDTIEQKRLGFLGLGLGQGAQMLGTQASVSNAGVGAQANIAGQQTALQGQLGSAGMSSMSGLISGGMQAAGSYYGGKAAAGSDIRLKDNITFIKKVGNYNIYSWDWNNIAKELFDYEGKDTGVIAQEVMEIEPDLVTEYKGYYVIKMNKLPKEVKEEVSYGL